MMCNNWQFTLQAKRKASRLITRKHKSYSPVYLADGRHGNVLLKEEVSSTPHAHICTTAAAAESVSSTWDGGE